jgi:hypothetical protein
VARARAARLRRGVAAQRSIWKFQPHAVLDAAFLREVWPSTPWVYLFIHAACLRAAHHRCPARRHLDLDRLRTACVLPRPRADADADAGAGPH